MKTKRIFNKNFIIIFSIIAVFAITSNLILTAGYSQEKNHNIIITELGKNPINLMADHFWHSVGQLKNMFNKPLQILIEIFREVFGKLFNIDNPRKPVLINENETKIAQIEIMPVTTYEEDCREEEIGVERSKPEAENQISEKNISKSLHRGTSNNSKPSSSRKTAYVLSGHTGSSYTSNDTSFYGDSSEYSNEQSECANINDTPVRTNDNESSDQTSNEEPLDITNEIDTFEMDTLEDSSPPEEDAATSEEESIPPYEPIEPFLVRSRKLPTGVEDEMELVILAKNDSGRDSPPIGVSRVTIKTLTSADGRNWRGGEINLNREDFLSGTGEEFYINVSPEFFNVYSHTEIELGSIVISGVEGFYCDYRFNIIVEDAYGRYYGSVDCGVTLNRLGADE